MDSKFKECFFIRIIIPYMLGYSEVSQSQSQSVFMNGGIHKL